MVLISKAVSFLIIILLISLPFFVRGQSKDQSHQKKKHPNVILIYTDDLGSLDLNILDAKDLYTPNIDGLARMGVRFIQFYAASSLCFPSRASLMTGRYRQRAGLVTNASSKKGGKI